MAPPLTRVGSPALTREELVNILTMPLAQTNVVLNSGVRIYEGTTATPLKIPKLTEFSVSGWYAEGETIADGEAPTDYLTLLPPTLKSVKTWLPMSSEVIRNSPLALDAAMRDQLVFSVSRLLEIAFLKGDSTPDADGNHTPQGVLNWAGTQTTDMAGVAPTLDDFAAMITDLENAFAQPRRWFMTPSMWNLVRTMKDTLERYQLNPQPTGDTTRSLWGIPVTTTVHLADATAGQSSIILADTEFIAVGRDQAPEARIFTETLAKNDEIALRVSCRYDIGPIWPQAIVILNNAAEVAA
jgi:HK97 family phage major capsid protein